MSRILLTWLAAAASVLGGLYTIWPTNSLTGVQGALLAAISIIFLLAASTDIYDHWQRLPKRCATDAEINDYMFRWISKAGRAVVFTRDHLGLLRDGRIKELLLAKAKSHELTMCLPKHTDLTRELKTAGAEILVYERLKYTPKARFTIIKDGRGAEAQVAIGKNVKGIHMIEDFPVGDPVFSVCSDLVEILRKIQR